jgi:hypothetical protein
MEQHLTGEAEAYTVRMMPVQVCVILFRGVRLACAREGDILMNTCDWHVASDDPDSRAHCSNTSSIEPCTVPATSRPPHSPRSCYPGVVVTSSDVLETSSSSHHPRSNLDAN